MAMHPTKDEVSRALDAVARVFPGNGAVLIVFEIDKPVGAQITYAQTVPDPQIRAALNAIMQQLDNKSGRIVIPGLTFPRG